jgi:WD40 repeat protein
MVDTMVKALDPNNPTVREALQNIVTINFAELVKIFPMIAFHASTQRLAVGSLDGSSVIYDLRTATKLNILEGHHGAVHGISFSPNGKLIASLSLQENQIAFWQPALGFLDSLKGAFGTSGSQGIQLSIGVGKVKPYRTFPIGAPIVQVDVQQVLDGVQFEWTSDRSLKLHSIGGVELSFSV